MLRYGVPPSEASGRSGEGLTFLHKRHLTGHRAEHVQFLISPGARRLLAWVVFVRLHDAGRSTDPVGSG